MVLFSLILSTSVLADLKSSEVIWTGSKVVGGSHYGALPIKSANIKANEGNIQSANIVFDLKKIDVTELSGEWKNKFLSHIKSGDFFEVDKYPEAKLLLTEVKNNLGKGQLTIKDKTHPIEIKFNKKGKLYSGTVEFDRTKYNIVYGSKNFFKNLGDKAISNNVKVDFKLELK